MALVAGRIYLILRPKVSRLNTSMIPGMGYVRSRVVSCANQETTQ
jgi:hypothetical protein